MKLGTRSPYAVHRVLARSRALKLVGFALVMASACGESAPQPISEQLGRLSPGRYFTDDFEPKLSLEVGGGWELSELQQKPLFEISKEREIDDYFAAISFNVAPSSVNDPKTPNKLIPAPMDWVTWFQKHPYLQTSPPRPTSVGGVDGREFDTRTSLPEDYSTAECLGQGVPLWPLLHGHHWCADAGFTSRTIVLDDVEGDTMIIDVWSRSGTFESALSEGKEVLNTVEWAHARTRE